MLAETANCQVKFPEAVVGIITFMLTVEYWDNALIIVAEVDVLRFRR